LPLVWLGQANGMWGRKDYFVKKTIILLCMLFIIQLTACSKAREAVATGEAASGAPVGTEACELELAPEDRNQSFGALSFVETTDGYYFGCNSLVYFCPRGGDVFLPLCCKPNCEHRDRNCNAWVELSAFGYYDGALYAVSAKPDSEVFKLELIKIKMDGTDHQVVAEEKLDVPTDSSYRFYFHHGKLFVQTSTAESVICSGLPLDQREDHLIVLDLSDYSQREPFSEYIEITPTFYRDKVYGYEGRYEIETEPSKLLELDTATGEVRTLIPDVAGPSIYVSDSTLYYFEEDYSLDNGDDDTDFEEGNPGFREIDLKTGAIKDCGMPLEDIWWASYGADYIYAHSYPMDSGDYKLYILSREYELLDQITLHGDQYICGEASDRAFILDHDSQYRFRITHYIEKSKIGSGELKLIPIERFG